MDNLTEQSREELERDYVRNTYDNIAEQFSSTRYKKWPKVEAFLSSISEDSLVLDVGCGNGKYLDSKSTFNIGCDLSSKLLTICRRKQFQVVQCDMMQLPFRSCIFDTIICVAALHHIVGTERRQKCLEEMTSLLHDHKSRLLIQVWAFEQELERDNPYLKQDRKISDATRTEVSINHDLKIPIHVNRTPFQEQDLLVPFKGEQHKECAEPSSTDKHGGSQNLRYYHVFKQYELESMIHKIPDVSILDSYYDKGNWCAVIGKKQVESKSQCRISSSQREEQRQSRAIT